MAKETDAERIKRLQELCARFDALSKQADEICRAVNAEIRRAEIAGRPERRVKGKKVKLNRRKS